MLVHVIADDVTLTWRSTSVALRLPRGGPERPPSHSAYATRYDHLKPKVGEVARHRRMAAPRHNHGLGDGVPP